MYKRNDESGRWIVEGVDGSVVAKFHGQAEAIDFAQRLRRSGGGILVIDVHRCLIQLISSKREELAS